MRVKVFISILLSTAILFVASPSPTHASVLDDMANKVKSVWELGVNTVKDILNIEEKQLSIDSKIELAPRGDLNKNGEIDAGDFVKFSYVITNPTEKTYKAVLKTNVNVEELNSISNVKGVLSLNTTKDTISIPHLNIAPNQVRKLSFEARVNFYKDADQSITTEAELVDEKNSSIFKGQKKEVKAKKMDLERFNKFVNITE